MLFERARKPKENSFQGRRSNVPAKFKDLKLVVCVEAIKWKEDTLWNLELFDMLDFQATKSRE